MSNSNRITRSIISNSLFFGDFPSSDLCITQGMLDDVASVARIDEERGSMNIQNSIPMQGIDQAKNSSDEDEEQNVEDIGEDRNGEEQMDDEDTYFFGLPCDGGSGLKELMLGTPSDFGPKHPTLDFLELGIAASVAPTHGLSALITFMGSNLDMVTSAGSFGGGDFCIGSWTFS